MTYLEFHAFFTLPPLLALAGPAVAYSRRLGSRRLVAIAIVPVIAVLYTTPWDNYLVASGIWSYGADRVAAARPCFAVRV